MSQKSIISNTLNTNQMVVSGYATTNQVARFGGKLWMDELGFYVPSTVFQSFRDDGRVNMKGSVQWSAV